MQILSRLSVRFEVLCDKREHWKWGDHKEKCAELQAKQKAALLGTHGPDPALASGGGGWVRTAAASGVGGGAAPPPISAEGKKSADAEPAHPCLICLEEENDAEVDGTMSG